MWSKIDFLGGPKEPLLATFKGGKLKRFGYFARLDTLSKIILRDTLASGRRRDRQRKCWMDNIKEWTSLPIPELLMMASRTKRLEKIFV